MEGTLEEKRKEVVKPTTLNPTSTSRLCSASLRHERGDHSTVSKSGLPLPPAALVTADGQGGAGTDQMAAGAAASAPRAELPQATSQQLREEKVQAETAEMDADTPLDLEVDGE